MRKKPVLVEKGGGAGGGGGERGGTCHEFLGHRKLQVLRMIDQQKQGEHACTGHPRPLKYSKGEHACTGHPRPLKYSKGEHACTGHPKTPQILQHPPPPKSIRGF